MVAPSPTDVVMTASVVYAMYAGSPITTERSFYTILISIITSSTRRQKHGITVGAAAVI